MAIVSHAEDAYSLLGGEIVLGEAYFESRRKRQPGSWCGRQSAYLLHPEACRRSPRKRRFGRIERHAFEAQFVTFYIKNWD